MDYKLFIQTNKIQMKSNFAQSQQSNYFTPKKRSQTADKFYSDKAQRSTAQKFYDLQDSFKHYEQLLQQNLYLKNLLLKQNVVQLNKQKFRKPSYQNLNRQQQYFQKRYGRNSSTNPSSSKGFYPTMPLQLGHDERYTRQNQQCNDIVLWSMKQRNNFLQQKLSNLKHQYLKQTSSIKKVLNSQKWKNRFDCTENSCYQDKYVKLLRVKSPVFLE